MDLDQDNILDNNGPGPKKKGYNPLKNLKAAQTIAKSNSASTPVATPKPKKTYQKPGSNPVNNNSEASLPFSMLSSNKATDSGYNLAYSTLPKTTASVVANIYGGGVNAIASTQSNIVNRELREANLSDANSRKIKNQPYSNKADQKYYDDNVKAYYNTIKKAKGDNGEGFFTRLWNKADLTAWTAGTTALDYIGIQMGHVMDLPDMLQNVKLPDHYDLKNIATSLKQLGNEYSTFDKKLTTNLFSKLGMIDPNTNKKNLQIIDQQYAKNSSDYATEKLVTSKKYQTALKNNTLDQEKQSFYSGLNPALGALNYGMKTLNKSAAWIDDKVFNDKDSGENFFSNIYYDQLDRDTLARKQAQELYDNEKKDELFKKNSAILSENIKNDPDRLAKALQAEKNKIYGKKRSDSFFTNNWDDQTKSFFDKLTDSNSYEGVEDIVDFDNKFMPMVGQTIGTLAATELTLGAFSIFGSTAGAGGRVVSNLASDTKVARTLSKTKPVKTFSEITKNLKLPSGTLRGFEEVKSSLKAVPFSYTMAYDESKQIGHDVYEKAIEDKITKATGIKKETFYKQFTPENGEDFTPGEIASMDQAYDKEVVEKFKNERPEEFKRIIKLANDASELATTTNLMPGTLTNLLVFGKFFNTKKALFRATQRFLPFLEKPMQSPLYKWTAQGVKTSIGEGVLEEAGINLIAQRKGESFAEGKYYGIDDYIKEVGSKEYMDNLAGGLLMGNVQSAGMSIGTRSFLQDIKDYRDYKKVIKDYKELSKYTGQDELSKFLVTNLENLNSETYAQKTKEYENKLKALEANKRSLKGDAKKSVQKEIDNLKDSYEKENNKFITNKISNSLQTGTTHKLISTLENMAKEENISDEDKATILDNVDTIKKVEAIYNEHIDKADSGKIIANRYSNVVNSKNLTKLRTELAQAGAKKDIALARQARLISTEEATSKRGDYRTARPAKGGFLYADYAKIFNSNLDTVKDAFGQGTDFGDADLRDYLRLEEAQIVLEDAVDRGEVEFQNLISEEYQEKVGPKNEYYRDLSKINSDTKLSPEKKQSQIKSLQKKYGNILDRKDFNAIDNEVRIKLENQEAFKKEIENQIKQAKDAKIFEEQKEAERKVKEAQEQASQAKKNEMPLSEEAKETIEKVVPNKTMPQNEMSQEQFEDAEQRKVELEVKEELNPEEETELKELENQTHAESSRQELDNLLGESTSTTPVELSDSEADFLRSMGIDPEEVKSAPSFRSENVSAKEGDAGARSIDLEDADENYSPNVIKEDSGFENPFKNFIKSQIDFVARDQNISEDKVKAEDVLNRLIDIAGKEKAEKAWNIFQEGYKLNRPNSSVNFDRLYDIYFTDSVATLDNLLDQYTIPEDTTGEIEEEKKPEPTQTSSEVTPRFDENNKPIVSPVQEAIPEEDMLAQDTVPTIMTNNYRVAKSHLLLGKNYLLGILPRLFKNRSDVFESGNYEGLNIGNIFKLENYKKHKSDSLPMTLSIPEDYSNHRVKGDKEQGWKFMTFGEWERLTGYAKGSPEWLNKVPIIAHYEGQPTFYLNDATASTSMNIIERNPEDTGTDSQDKKDYFTYVNNDIRKRVFEGGSVPVQVKTRQTDLAEDTGSTGQTLNKFDKNILIGTWDYVAQNFKVFGNTFPTTNKIYSNFTKDHNSNVILKPTGEIDAQGNPEYQAFQVETNGLLNRNHTTSLMAALYSYLGREVRDMIPTGVQNFRDTLKNESGVDLENFVDLNNYINSISRTSYFEQEAKRLGLTERDSSGTTIDTKLKQSFAEFINNSKNKALAGQPQIAIIDYKVVFAVTPESGVLMDPNNVVIIDPLNITSQEQLQEAARLIINPYFTALNKTASSINISHKLLPNNKPYFLINSANPNELVKYDNYDGYLRNFITVGSSISVRQVQNADGSTQDVYGRYAVLEITEPNGFVKSFEEFRGEKDAVQEEKNQVEEAKTILEEKTPEKKVSNEEIQALVQEIKDIRKVISDLRAMDIPTKEMEDSLDVLTNQYREVTGEIYQEDNFSPNIISEPQVQEMMTKEKENFKDIEGLSLYQRQDLTNHIFNVIAGGIGYQKGAKISKKHILGDIKNKIEGILKQNIEKNNKNIEIIQKYTPNNTETVKELQAKNNVFQSIINNYGTLEEDVLELLEDKVGIKDVKDKSTGDNINDSQEETSELNDTEDPTETSEEDVTNGNEIDKDLVERDKSFNSSSLEVTGKATVSAKMKRFLARIPIMNKQGNVERGFLDLEKYYDFRDLDNEIKVALNSPKEIDSNYKTVIEKLKSIKDQYSWAEPLLNKLEDKNTPEQARIEFMYNYTGRHSINAKFVEFEMSSNGRFTTNIFDANFTDIAKNIRKEWSDNLKAQETLYDSTEDGSYRINPEKAQRLLDIFNNIYSQLGDTKGLPLSLSNVAKSIDGIKAFNAMVPGESVIISKTDIPAGTYKDFMKQLETNSKVTFKVNNKDLVEVSKDFDNNIIYTKPILSDNVVQNLGDWAKAVGINLNASTLTDLANNGLDLGKKGNLNFYSLLDPQNLSSPFSSVANNLRTVTNRAKLGQSLDIKDYNIFDEANNSLLALAKVESKYTNKIVTKNFRDNGKLMQGLPIGKYATDRVKELTDPDSGILDELSKYSFSKNSMLAKLLRDPKFAEIFKLSHTANGSFKQKDNRFQRDAKVSDLTALDLELAKLGFFFETNNISRYNQTILQDFAGDTDTRMGNVFLPTMSDKDQMMALETIIFNVNEFNYTDGVLSEPMLELLYSQLVKPDLERIASFHSKVQGSTDIKGYDEAAQLFTLLPSMNLLTDGKDTITNLMKRDPNTYNINYIEKTYKEKFKEEVNALLNHLVEEKLESWKNLEVIDAKNNIKINDKYLDGRKEKGNKDLLNRNLAAEFVLNNLVTNANMHMLVIGDPALYSQSKFFNKDKFTDGDPTKPINTNVYREWSETSLGTNLGKRLALMLAPGNKLYNSKGDMYHQIYLKDFVDFSTNILDLVEDFYGAEAKNNAKVELDRVKEINSKLSQENLDKTTINTLQDEKKASIKSLQKSFPRLGDYFDIETTDAQEYTTVAEHINVMRRQGRIDDETFAKIEDKLKAQQEEAFRGEPISQANMLTKKELGFVLQPIKPVHTGQIFDTDQDVVRTVYVKSSSFPLIPQLTYGKPIDGVRKVLEQYEAQANKNLKEGALPVRVRASYDTANKVGSTKNALSPFNPDGSFNESDFNIDNISSARLELNRNNFRIQQDVPNKSDKNKEDRVSYGTQMLKVLFSNGLLDVKTGFLNPSWDMEDMEKNKDLPKELSGRELFEEYNNAFIDLVNSKKSQLYRELGVNDAGFIQDEAKFKQNVAKLLNKEGKKRDYSKNDLNSLRLTEDNKFVLPLFLNNQSSKIESLLLSIIASRVIKHKLPGYSYVAGSEAGFKLNKSEDFKGVEGADRIIYTEDFTGELKGTVHKGSNEIEFAEVMVPSKLRTNQGELIDLYEKDNSESGYKYLRVDPETKRYILKKDASGQPMVQDHLLNLVTFRIPTSSHVSLSNVKIVGILPPESGDLIIVPKNFTKQKGLDFDVDKENTYHLWTYVNPQGRIKELSQGYIDYLSDKMEKKSSKSLANLKNEDSEYYKELISALGTEEAVTDFIENTERTSEEKLEDFKKAMNQKLIENKIVRIHTSVLGNPNKAVQNKINKILSMDFAKEQAENISMLREEGRKNSFVEANIDENNTREKVETDYASSNKYFTILSDEYQSYKMFLGSAGKSGIGVYSNFLTMSSLMQQYGKLGDFRLMEYNHLEGSYDNLNISIGGIGVIDGILGRINTIDGSRSISEVFEELQNTATDNEKEQIMGRTGINNHTISVFSIMSMLGIDKTPISKSVADQYNLNITDNKMSFGNLLLSQGIVNRIVEKLEYNNSNVTEFDNKQVIDIIKDLKKSLEPTRPYVEEGETIYGEDGEPLASNVVGDYDLLTGDNLVKTLGGETLEFQEDFDFQVLDLLERLYSFQTQFRNAQKILNVSSNGLGLDLIESNNYNQLLSKVIDQDPKNNLISGLEKLMFTRVGEGELSPQDKERVTYINEIYGGLIPTTPIGASILNSLSMTKRLYGDLFPYQSREYRDAIGYALSNTKITGNGQAKLNFERKFAKELKKYLFSNNNLYTGNTRSERERLFFDTKDNTSLANYLSSLKNSENEVSDYISQRVINNPLIKKFVYDVNMNSSKNAKSRFPSIIKYNDSNSIVENRDILYRALPELIINDIPLSPYNGQPYSTRALAQDLISYTFLEGGIQEIQQFVKYVPVSYLEVVGFSRDMINRYESLGTYLGTRSESGNKIIPSYVRQFFQHNPELATRISTFDNGRSYEELKASKVFNAITDNEFTLNSSTQQDLRILGNDFVSIYDPNVKGRNKYILFEKDPNDSSRFVKRETAGFMGLSEYDSTKRSVRPLKQVDINLPERPNSATVNSPILPTGDLGIGELSTQQVIDKLISLNNKFSRIIEPFRNFLPTNLEISIDPGLEANGVYSASNNTIRISQKAVDKGPLQLSNILVKELIHAATTNHVNKFLNKDGSLKSSVEIKDLPLPIRKLKVLYEELLKGGKDLTTSEGVSLVDYIRNYNLAKDRGAGQTIRQEDLNFYGFVDVFEFIEMGMTDSNFRDFLDQISDQVAKDRGMGFLDRLKDIFKGLWNDVTNKTVSKEVVDTITEVIFSNRDNIDFNENIDENYNPFISTENSLSRAKNLLDNNISSKFAEMDQDPFLC